MSSCRDPPIGGNEMAGLRAFLRSRCGSLKAAFGELDSHDVGQLTSDDFVKGLLRLGYAEDASAMFRSIDGAKSGLVTMKSFLNCLGDRMVEAIDTDRQHSMVKPLTRSASDDVWKSARIPKSSSPNLLTSHAVGGVLKSGSALRSSTPDDIGLTPTSPHMPVAGADLLYARISRVEEQVAAEQRLRCETEQRLTQHLNSLVGVSISEQLDVLRQQLVEERMQRQVDITSVRASLETVRSLALRSVQENLEECVKSEVDKSIGEVRMTLEQTACINGSKSPELRQKLDELSKSTEIRLAELEASVRSENDTTLRASVETVRSLARSVQESLEERVKSELDKSIGEVRMSLQQTACADGGDKSPEIEQKLDKLSKSTEIRLAELETSVRNVGDITSLRDSLEALRSLCLRSVQANLEQCVKSEVDKSIGEVRMRITSEVEKSIGEVRMTLEQMCAEGRDKSPELRQKLEQLSNSTENRLAELEASLRNVCRQFSCQSEDSQHMDALLQASLQLREAEVRLREQNLEMRERAVKMQEEEHCSRQDAPMQRPPMGAGGIWSHRPSVDDQGPCSCNHSPPVPSHPLRQSRTSLPPSGGAPRPAMVSPPTMHRADPRHPGTPVVEGRQPAMHDRHTACWVVNPQMPVRGARAPSPAVSHVPGVSIRRFSSDSRRVPGADGG
ncbi:unnamed protein product [Effrenium voratum]|nr:unnamed protein product [Effrenium voratum]